MPNDLITGKERDAETGLDYFGARYFSGAQGRFTSPDPFSILQEAGSREELDEYLSNPQHWNKYTYSLNNPLKYVDPDGNHPILIYLQQLAQRAAPYADRAAVAAQRYGQQAYVWATRFFNSPTGQEVTQAVAETALGYQGPSFNPIRAAENFGLRGIASEAGLITGKLASGAEVWAGFEKTGQNLAVNVLGAFNPDNVKGSLGTLKAITEGAVNAARGEGATSVTIRGIAVINQRLGTFLQKQGFQIRKIKLPDGTEVDAYEKTFAVN